MPLLSSCLISRQNKFNSSYLYARKNIVYVDSKSENDQKELSYFQISIAQAQLIQVATFDKEREMDDKIHTGSSESVEDRRTIPTNGCRLAEPDCCADC